MPRDHVRTLKGRLHAAKAALEARDHAMALVAHELRTPVNAVLGWLEMLSVARDVPPETRERALGVICRNAHQQLRLVNDLFDRALLMQGRLHMQIARIDFAEVVDRALDATRPAANQKGVTLIADLERRPLPMQGDAGRLHQVLVNLLANAVTFSPAGGRVLIVARRNRAGLEFIVRDSGPGIDRELVPVIFDAFERGVQVRSGGLGLGLAIAKSIAEMHGGSIRVENAADDGGAMFFVALPDRGPREQAADRPRRADRRRRVPR